MNARLGLLRLLRVLSADRSERRRLAAAAVVCQRQSSLAALAPLLRVLPTGSKPKLRLWQAQPIAALMFARSGRQLRCPMLAASIRSTRPMPMLL